MQNDVRPFFVPLIDYRCAETTIIFGKRDMRLRFIRWAGSSSFGPCVGLTAQSRDCGTPPADAFIG